MSSPLDSPATNSKLTGILVIILGLIAAGFAGVWVGEENWMPLSILLGGSAIAGLILGLKDNWWVVIPWMIVFGYSTLALGFKLTGVDIAALLAFGIISLRIALHTRTTKPQSLRIPRIFYVLCLYVFLHAILALINERYGGENQIKNVIKAYYQAVTPLVLLWMMTVYASSSSVRMATTGMMIITFPTFIIGIVITYLSTYISFLSHPYFGFDWAGTSAFGHIRWISISFFTLSICLSTCTRSFLFRCICYGCALLAICGALLGGGRIALASCIVLAVFWLLLRKNITVMFIGGTVALIFLATINVHRGFLEILPKMAQRSVTPFVISGELTQEQGATELSDQWHSDLRAESWIYWQDTFTSVLVGHGYKGWDDNIDMTTFTTGPLYENAKKIAIQMGRTERSFSSILVIFGIIGVVLYYGFMVALVVRLWRLRKLTPRNSFACAMCEFSICIILISLITAFHAGSVPSYEMIFWFFGIVATREYVPALFNKNTQTLKTSQSLPPLGSGAPERA